MKNEEVLIYESVLNYQMNKMQSDNVDEIKLLDLKHYKLQYCLDVNSERIQKEAEKIRKNIDKIQSEKHKELIEKFREGISAAAKSNPEITEQGFLDTWELKDDLTKELESFLPKREQILKEDSGVELYKIKKSLLDSDLPINRHLFMILKPFLLED